MLEKTSIALTEFFCRKGAIDASKKPIFIYGFQLALSTLCSLISISILSVCLGTPLSALMFFLVFFCTRLFSGGYHASSYHRCFLLTNTVYLAIVLFAGLFARTSSFLFHIFIQAIAGVVILVLAPIRHPNHPLSETIYQRNQKTARWMVVLFELSFPLLYYLSGNLSLMSLFSASLMAVVILMIIPKYQERRGHHE